MRVSARQLVLMPLLAAAAAGLGCGEGRPDAETLTVVLEAAPPARDPLAEFDELTDTVLGSVFQPVLSSPLGAAEWRGVATRWSNPDSTTWDLEVDPEAAFQHGRRVTADDVVASLRAAMYDAGSAYAPFLRDIVEVHARDADTVRLRTGVPVNMVPNLAMVPVVPGGKRFGAGELPVGSGPYCVREWRDDELIALEWCDTRRERGRHPLRVEFQIRSGAARQKAVLAQRRPVMGFTLSKEVVESAPLLGLEAARVGAMASSFIVCNVRQGHPTARLEVRRAIAAAATPDTLRDRLALPQRAADDLFPSGVFGHRPGHYRARPEWALRDPAAVGLMRLVVVEPMRETGAAFREVLMRAGFRVELEVLPMAKAFEALRAGRFDLTLLGYNCATGSGMELIEVAFLSGAGVDQPNYSGYSSARLESLAAEARSSLDQAEQQMLLERLAAVALEDLPWIPLLEMQRVVLHSPDVTWRVPSDGRLHLLQLELLE